MSSQNHMLLLFKNNALHNNSLTLYKNETGAYIDSDEDNIPDIVESLLSNNSTFAKFASLFADPTSEYYNASLWENYSWCIAYFYSIQHILVPPAGGLARGSE